MKNRYKFDKMIETSDYKFMRAKKHSASGRMHGCLKIQIYNSMILTYVRLSVWYVESSNDLTNKQSKNIKMR